jgi:hypothetical protein
MTRRRRTPNRARRVDLVALAERHLYPGLPWRRFTRDQRIRTVDLARAYLIERGEWPAGYTEREDERRGRAA